jgi:hypothetical protein
VVFHTGKIRHMFKELSEQLQAHGYWFNVMGPDNTFILNTEEPSVSPAIKDFEPGRGVIMTAQVLKYELLAKWAQDEAGYDETWEFPNVAEFMKFYDKFMTDGIDGV